MEGGEGCKVFFRFSLGGKGCGLSKKGSSLFFAYVFVFDDTSGHTISLPFYPPVLPCLERTAESVSSVVQTGLQPARRVQPASPCPSSSHKERGSLSAASTVRLVPS